MGVGVSICRYTNLRFHSDGETAEVMRLILLII